MPQPRGREEAGPCRAVVRVCCVHLDRFSVAFESCGVSTHFVGPLTPPATLAGSRSNCLWSPLVVPLSQPTTLIGTDPARVAQDFGAGSHRVARADSQIITLVAMSWTRVHSPYSGVLSTSHTPAGARASKARVRAQIHAAATLQHLQPRLRRQRKRTYSARPRRAAKPTSIRASGARRGAAHVAAEARA